MTFWQDDALTLLSDFGLTLTHAGGDTTKAVLDDEESVEDDGVGGQRLMRRQGVRIKTGTLPTLAVGDTVKYDNTDYIVRDDIHRETDGVFTVVPVVPA